MMPLLGFKKFLVPMLIKGDPWWKLGTIRALRKKPIKKWDILYMYTGLRTKDCQYLGVSLCTNEYTFTMHLERFYACISTFTRGKEVFWEEREIEELAIGDGFASASKMWEWFRRTHNKQEICQRIEWKITPIKLKRSLLPEQQKVILTQLNGFSKPLNIDFFMKHLHQQILLERMEGEDES